MESPTKGWPKSMAGVAGSALPRRATGVIVPGLAGILLGPFVIPPVVSSFFR